MSTYDSGGNTYYTSSSSKAYTVKTLEEFVDVTNILKDALPRTAPTVDIHIIVLSTYERYKWNYITRTFDLVHNNAYSTTANTAETIPTTSVPFTIINTDKDTNNNGRASFQIYLIHSVYLTSEIDKDARSIVLVGATNITKL